MTEILTGDKSIYLQICDMLETDILRDVLAEDERIPSTNELSRLYTINPATAAKGINLLTERGILYKKRGVGMFVAPGAKARIMAERRERFVGERLKAFLLEAKNLGITKNDLIKMIEGQDWENE